MAKKKAPKAAPKWDTKVYDETLPVKERLVIAERNKSANPALEERLAIYRERFHQLNGRFPEQNEIPKRLGGTGD